MIKLVIFDFDGVFTNNKIFFNSTGNIIKYYNVKDGTGIKLLKENNIEVGVISGYKENISQKKILEHLNIKYISFGENDKLNVLNTWCKELEISFNEVAYMGDDINDLNILSNVKLSGCPKDAIDDCLKICKFISSKNGGEGCIREFCEFIIKNQEQDNPKEFILQEIKDEFYYQINNFNINDIYKLAEIIKKSLGNIYLCGVGKSGNIAKHCCDLFKCISYSSFYFDILNSTHGDIGTLKNKDIILLFSNSGDTSEIINIIPLFKEIGCKIIGICSNKNSKFSELCDENLIIPFNKEISGIINKIPTNSCMSQLIFSNILVSILKENISQNKYKQNHLGGIIGKSLLKIKDCLTTEFPKIIIDENNKYPDILNILIEINKYEMEICCFINKDNKLIGILTEGDIRRELINNNLVINNINIDKIINKNYLFETDPEKYVINCKQIGLGYLPLIINNKLKGIVSILI